MKTTVNEYAFRRAFETTRPDNFSYAGLSALFEYFEQYEEDTGEEMELDVIAICCDFTEYENLADFQANYGEEYETLEDIEDATQVITWGDIEDTPFIVQNF